MGIVLTVTEGPGKGRVFKFEGHDFFLVGRSNKAHFQLPREDRSVSRIHFFIEANPPVCRLLDMNSHNGTHVNGEKVERADLRNGDVIKAGKTRLRVSVTDADPAELVTIAEPLKGQRPAAAAAAVPAAAPPPAARNACPICGADVDPASRPLCARCRAEAGKLAQPIDGYLIVRVIGQGGMGIVYRGVCLADGGPVAVKTFLPKVSPSPKQIARFLRDTAILRQLQHPHIVAFRDLGQSAKGQLYCVMEYVPGTDAAHILAHAGPLPVRRAVRLIDQLLDALEYAHARGFVHRDIKPANLLATEAEATDFVKLADFGLARNYQTSMMSGLTLEGELLGTLAFMPPEQITNSRDVQPAGDQYSAAATLYNLLTGKFIHDPVKDVRKQLVVLLEKDPVPIRNRRADLPAELARCIHQALAREPADRFEDVRGLRQALAGFLR